MKMSQKSKMTIQRVRPDLDDGKNGLAELNNNHCIPRHREPTKQDTH